jgi:hypothetical protein
MTDDDTVKRKRYYYEWLNSRRLLKNDFIDRSDENALNVSKISSKRISSKFMNSNDFHSKHYWFCRAKRSWWLSSCCRRYDVSKSTIFIVRILSGRIQVSNSSNNRFGLVRINNSWASHHGEVESIWNSFVRMFHIYLWKSIS